MYPDPVIEEIRQFREELAAKFNYDLAALVQYARDRDALGDWPVVRREPRPPMELISEPVKNA